MSQAPGTNPSRCRALIAGFGVPAQRDLDFGRQVISYLEPFAWPHGVVVEELSYSAHLVLHRLRELGPSKLVLIGATARGVDAPGTVRLRRIDAALPVSGTAGTAATGVDHTLGVLRQWGGLPADTFVIEVEPVDCGLGHGFSDELASCFDEILSRLRDVLGDDFPSLPLTVDDFTAEPEPGLAAAVPTPPETPDALLPLVDFAARCRDARSEERHRGAGHLTASRTLTDGNLVVAGRHRPWAIGIDGGSDWYETFALDHGTTGVVIGSVPGRGVDAAGLKADMRIATRAYAVLEGRFPSRLVACLDDFTSSTGLGESSRVTYLTVQPDTGEVRLCTAGLAAPLLLTGRGGGRVLDERGSASLGAGAAGHRVETLVHLEPGDTLLLYTDGLVAAAGRAALLDAALCGPSAIDQLCDHVMGACLNRSSRRADDASLVGVRLLPQSSWDRISAE